MKLSIDTEYNYQSPTSEQIQLLWKSLFSLENPIDCLIEIRKISLREVLTISSFHASFLTSLYTDKYSSYPQELRTQASLLISSLFSQNLSLVSLFDKFGLFSLVYPLFPNFKIPSFLHFYAERSFQCAQYLIENGFIPILIDLLSSTLKQLNCNLGINIQIDKRDENIDNFLDYILCAGSICDFNQFENQLLPFGPILISIIINVDDWKIQCEALNSLSILLKNIDAAAKDFLLSDSILSIISPTKCQSNIFYLMSVINLIGSLLKHSDLLNETFYEESMKIFSTSLNLLKSKCGINESYDSCISLIANAVADGCSDQNPNFPKMCFNCGLIQLFFEIFNDENPWNLKINLYEAILKLFSIGLSDTESLNTFLSLGFMELFIDNLSEMSFCNGYAITLTLNSIITYLTKIGTNKNIIFINALLSEEVEEVIELLLQSDDSEIKFSAAKVEVFIQDLYKNQ